MATKHYRDMNKAERAEYTKGKSTSQLAPAPESPWQPTESPAEPETVVDPIALLEEVKSDDDAKALTDLQRIALELGRAAADSQEEQRAADHIFRLLEGLTAGARSRLFQNNAVKRLFEMAVDKEANAPGAPNDPPGTIYYRTVNGERIPWRKKPWTWSDLRTWPTKEWIPDKQRNLGWNGLMVTVRPRRPVRLPECFHGVYESAVANEEAAEQHAAYLFGSSNDAPQDRSILTDGSGRVRATSMMGRHKGVDQNVHVPGGGFVAQEPGNAHTAEELDAP